MIFARTYLQQNHFVSVKDMRNLQQNIQLRWNKKKVQNDGSGKKYNKPGHAHGGLSENPQNCEAVD